MFRKAQSDSEEDEDYKSPTASHGVTLNEHLVFSFDISSATTVADIKQRIIDKV